MTLHSNVYLSEGLVQKEHSIIEQIKNGDNPKGIQCICIFNNDNNLMEIMDINKLEDEFYARCEYVIVGLAEALDTAKELVRQIVEDVYRNQRDVDVKRYFGIK